MRTFKQLFTMLLFLTGVKIPGVAQGADSVEISGTVQWKDTSIKGYPEALKIIPFEGQELLRPIEANGKYHFRLPLGSYTIEPSTHYHWMEDEYIRINDSISRIYVQLLPGNAFTVPVLELDTIAIANLLPEAGVTQHFTSSQAALTDDFIKKQMAFFEIPGASLAIIKNGRLIHHQIYGVDKIQSGKAVTKKTLFETGSVTKSVFAFAVMRLVEKDVLKLDQPLYELLPFDEVSRDERYQKITARHVLSHQTGLPNWGQPDSSGHFNLLFTPGTAFGYSGEGYEYLKRVVEHLTHKSISQILDELLLMPFQLRGFNFTGNDHVKQFSAHGHNDLKPANIRLIKEPMMAFSLFTEAKAFSTFMLVLRNRKGLKKQSYDELFRPQSTREDGVNWGLGFELNHTSKGFSYGHSGSTSSGFICNFTFFPALDTGYVLFTNSDMGAKLCIPLLTQFLITGRNQKTN